MKWTTLQFGWWTPLRIVGLAVTQADGQSIVDVEQVHTDLTLWRLLSGGDDLGHVRLVEPAVWIRSDGRQTNWQSLLERFPSGAEPSRLRPSRVTIQHGIAHVQDEVAGQRWQIVGIEGQADLVARQPERWSVAGQLPGAQRIGPRLNAETDAPDTLPIALKQTPSAQATAGDQAARGKAIDVASSTSRCSFRLDLEETDRATRDASFRATGELVLQDYPTDWLGVWIRWLDPHWSHEATATGTVHGELDGRSWNVVCPRPLLVDGLHIERAGFLKDALRFAQVRTHGAIRRDSEGLHIADGRIVCDWGEATMAADWSIGTSEGEAVGDATPRPDAISDRLPFRIASEGRIDLATAVGSLRRTLRVRQDTRLVSGDASWSLQLGEQGGEVRLDLSDVTAMRQGRELAIAPVRLEGTIVADGQVLRVDTLVGRSTFAAFSARGDRYEGAFALRTNLSRLNEQLGQLIDLPFRSNGTLEAKMQWRPELAENGQTGLTAQPSAVRVTTALRANAVTVRTRPGQWPKDAAAMIDGDVRMITRLSRDPPELVVTDDAASASSSPDARSDLRYSFAGELLNGRIQVAYGKTRWDLREEKMPVSGHGMWRPAQTQWSLDRVRVVGALGQAEADSVVWTPGAWYAKNVHYQCGLQLLRPLVGSEIAGKLHGRAAFQWKSDGWSLESENQIEQWRYVLASGGDWQEPDMRIQWDATFDRRSRTGSIRRLRLVTEPATFELNGELNGKLARELPGQQKTRQTDAENDPDRSGRDAASGENRDDWQLVLAGQVHWNLQAAAQRLASIGQIRVQADGRSSSPIRFQASFPSGRVKLATSVQWDRLDLFGVSTTAGQVPIFVDRRSVELDPLRATVSGGQLQASAAIGLVGPFPLQLRPGAELKNAQLTRPMCQGWLKYVAPVLADATAAEGELSIRLAEVAVPLSRPAAATVAGSMRIHRGVVGPGPLAQQLLSVIQQLEQITGRSAGPDALLSADARWIELPEQQVSFRLADGRVAHRGLQLVVANVPVQTRGWVQVRAPEQMSLVAEVPIQERWISGQRWLSGLKGQTLEIPVSGTLRSPTLDRRTLERFSRRAVRQAAEKVIEKELQNQVQGQLQRLFGRPK